MVESKVDDKMNKNLDFKDESNTDVKENSRTRIESTGSMFSVKDENEEDNTPFLKTINKDMTGWFESFERQTTDWSSSEKTKDLVI